MILVLYTVAPEPTLCAQIVCPLSTQDSDSPQVLVLYEKQHCRCHEGFSYITSDYVEGDYYSSMLPR